MNEKCKKCKEENEGVQFKFYLKDRYGSEHNHCTIFDSDEVEEKCSDYDLLLNLIYEFEIFVNSLDIVDEKIRFLDEDDDFDESVEEELDNHKSPDSKLQ